MKKNFLRVIFIALIFSFCVITPVYCAPVQLKLNINLTFDPDGFAECDDPRCQLLASIWDKHSADIMQFLGPQPDNTAEASHVNITVSHEKKSWLYSFIEWLGFGSENSSSKQNLNQAASFNKREQAEKSANKIFALLEIKSGDIELIEFIDKDNKSSKIFSAQDGGLELNELRGDKFFDAGIFLENLKSVCGGKLTVRSQERFNAELKDGVNSQDVKEILSSIADKAVFNFSMLEIFKSQGDAVNGEARGKLINWLIKHKELNGKFKFYFKTDKPGVYIVKELSRPGGANNKYMAMASGYEGKYAAITRGTLESELKDTLSLSSGILDFWLSRKYSELSQNITLERCLKIFTEDIKSQLVKQEISAEDIAEFKAKAGDALPKNFWNTGALEKADSTNLINLINLNYFADSELNLNFCRVWPNSQAEYGFVDSNKLKALLKSFNSGGFEVQDQNSFSFKSSQIWKANAGSVMLAMKDLEPEHADKTEKVIDKHDDFTRLFFRTKLDGVYLTVFIFNNKPDEKPRFYIAAPRSVFSLEDLNKIFNAKINYDEYSEKITLKLWQPDVRLQSSDLDKCLDIFASQLLKYNGNIETAR